MAIVYLGLGSNVDVETNLHRAVAALREQFSDIELSPVYRSPPLGFDGDDFLNLVVRFSTDTTPGELLDYFDAITGSKERVWLVHGEPKQSASLCEELRERCEGEVSVAEWKSTVEF